MKKKSKNGQKVAAHTRLHDRRLYVMQPNVCVGELLYFDQKFVSILNIEMIKGFGLVTKFQEHIVTKTYTIAIDGKHYLIETFKALSLCSRLCIFCF